jgi:putative ABC transport system permease protein
MVGTHLRVVAWGVVGGLVAALAVTRIIGASLYGAPKQDLASLAEGSALLLISAVAACVIPAKRALGIDPVTALRAD